MNSDIVPSLLSAEKVVHEQPRDNGISDHGAIFVDSPAFASTRTSAFARIVAVVVVPPVAWAANI